MLAKNAALEEEEAYARDANTAAHPNYPQTFIPLESRDVVSACALSPRSPPLPAATHLLPP